MVENSFAVQRFIGLLNDNAKKVNDHVGFKMAIDASPFGIVIELVDLKGRGFKSMVSYGEVEHNKGVPSDLAKFLIQRHVNSYLDYIIRKEKENEVPEKASSD